VGYQLFATIIMESELKLCVGVKSVDIEGYLQTFKTYLLMHFKFVCIRVRQCIYLPEGIFLLGHILLEH